MKIVVASLLILLISCKTPEQTIEKQVLDFGSFTIEAPSNWKKIKETGFDSYVGKIEMDSGEVLEFDLGMYSNKLTEENLMVSWDTIDNRRAKVVVPQKGKSGITGVYIDSLWFNDSGNIRFNLYGMNLNANNRRLLLQAIKTLKFYKSK